MEESNMESKIKKIKKLKRELYTYRKMLKSYDYQTDNLKEFSHLNTLYDSKMNADVYVGLQRIILARAKYEIQRRIKFTKTHLHKLERELSNFIANK